jgi:hypothetical protein
MLKTALGVALAAALIAAGPAHAGLVGSTVDVTAYFPTQASPLSDGGVQTVGAGVEYPFGSFPSYQNQSSVDLDDTQIVIDGIFGQVVPATFNGFGITSLTGQHIVVAVANPASTLLPVSLNIVGNELFVGFQGTLTTGETEAIIDIRTAPIGGSGTPEPATWALMLLGTAGMGLALRRARRLAAA